MASAIFSSSTPNLIRRKFQIMNKMGPLLDNSPETLEKNAIYLSIQIILLNL